MSKVVIIDGHPNLGESNANSTVINHLTSQLPDVKVHSLAKEYPNHQFDIKADQELLKNADTIILQFPFYWYSMPGAMKLWLDQILEFGFAYGPDGDKLKGKQLIVSVTIGGPEEEYSPDGYNTYPIADLLLPIKQTAILAGLNFKPVWTHGMIYIPGVYGDLDLIKAKAQSHATRIIGHIK